MRIYEKHPHADAYRIGRAYVPYASIAVDKRFTDAELAAEFHKADSDCAVYWLTDRDKHMRAWAKMYTLRRFAALPHYDEEPQ